MLSAKSSSREGTRISLVCVHTNEGGNPAGVLPDRTAENLAEYLNRPNVAASYHVIADDDSVVRYLPDHVAAWSLRSGNSRSLNLCFAGWARWSRSEWLAHREMLTLGAVVVRDWCVIYRIPVRKLIPAQVGADWSGICGHHDWTVGKRDGTHTDPGPGFPWDVFLELVHDRDNVTKRGENMLTNHRVSDRGALRLICPVGKASAITARAWVSATVDGPEPGKVAVWFQDDDSGISELRWDIGFRGGRSVRRWAEVPDGTTQINIAHDLPGDGTICLETESR